MANSTGLSEPGENPSLAVDATELDARVLHAWPMSTWPAPARWRGPIEALWSDGEGSLWLGSGAKVVQFDPRLHVGRY